MNSFKQALNHFKNHWQHSLMLGLASTLILSTTKFIPFVSAFFISLVLLLLQYLTQQLIEKGTLKNTVIQKNDLGPFLVVALILFPTSVLIGSAMGIASSPQSHLTSLPTALLLLTIASYFYLVLVHSLRLRMEEHTPIAKAIDLVGMASVKNSRLYLAISFYLALFILLSDLTRGLGFLISLPLVFYSTYFSYAEAKRHWPLHTKHTKGY